MIILFLAVVFYTNSDICLADMDIGLWTAAQNRQPSFIQDLRGLVNLDSGTGNARGLGRVQALLVNRLKALGARVEIIAAPPAAGKIVLGSFTGAGAKNIMLMIHYDTVFPVGEAVRRPFKIAGNRAFGPGVADAKGGVLIILHALEIARNRGFKEYKTLSVFFNPDEENSSVGSHDILEKLASRQDIVLSFEPPEAERVIIATNGVARIHLDVKGLAAHAGSSPEKGRNAAMEIANQILQLKNLENSGKGTTINWTVLQAGDSERVNIIPDRASAKADMRMSDISEIERVQNDANSIIRNKLIPDTEVDLRVENRRPPFARNPATDTLAERANVIYREIGKTLQPVAMRYGTDAGFASNPHGGKPTVLEGMGIVGDRLHSADEWADLDSVAPRIYLLARMLGTLSALDNDP